jgi:hypothetical protein
MTVHSVDRLSEYLDGELPPAEREEIERHLETCEECSAALAELRGVVARVQALNDRPPSTDLWPGIAAFIGDQPVVRPLAGARRRFSLTIPQLLAAGIALMALSAGAMTLLLRRQATPAPIAAAPAPATAGVPAATTGHARGYDAAVLELQQVLANGRGRLDSTTVRVLEEKLALIDKAIAEAERALATDPKDPYLHGHLADTQMQKLKLLRRAAMLAASAS